MIFQLLKFLFSNNQPTVSGQRHYIDGEMYTEEVRNGFVYLKDSRGFVTMVKDSRGMYVKAK